MVGPFPTVVPQCRLRTRPCGGRGCPGGGRSAPRGRCGRARAPSRRSLRPGHRRSRGLAGGDRVDRCSSGPAMRLSGWSVAVCRCSRPRLLQSHGERGDGQAADVHAAAPPRHLGLVQVAGAGREQPVATGGCHGRLEHHRRHRPGLGRVPRPSAAVGDRRIGVGMGGVRRRRARQGGELPPGPRLLLRHVLGIRSVPAGCRDGARGRTGWAQRVLARRRRRSTAAPPTRASAVPEPPARSSVEDGASSSVRWRP